MPSGNKGACYESGEASYTNVDIKILPRFIRAILKRDEAKVADLLTLKAEKCLLQVDEFRRTPLHYAAYFGYTEIVALITQYDEVSSILESRDEMRKTALFKAVECGSSSCLKLLLSAGALPTVYEISGTTALHVAVLKNSIRLVQILVDAGANTNSSDQLGFTPLHIAAGMGHSDIAKCLLENGAGVDFRDNKGRTPLFGAATDFNASMAKLLLDYGADPHAVDLYGNSLLQGGTFQIDDEVRSVLEQASEGSERTDLNAQNEVKEEDTGKRGLLAPVHPEHDGIPSTSEPLSLKYLATTPRTPREVERVLSSDDDAASLPDDETAANSRKDAVRENGNNVVDTVKDKRENAVGEVMEEVVLAEVASQEESFMDSLDVVEHVEKGAHSTSLEDSLKPLSSVDSSAARYEFLKRKNRELLLRKLKKCDELKIQMKAVVEQYNMIDRRPKPVLPRDNDAFEEDDVDEVSASSAKNDYNFLRQELIVLRSRNAELNEELVRVKRTRLRHDDETDDAFVDSGLNSREASCVDRTSMKSLLLTPGGPKSFPDRTNELLRKSQPLQGSLDNDVDVNDSHYTRHSDVRAEYDVIDRVEPAILMPGVGESTTDSDMAHLYRTIDDLLKENIDIKTQNRNLLASEHGKMEQIRDEHDKLTAKEQEMMKLKKYLQNVEEEKSKLETECAHLRVLKASMTEQISLHSSTHRTDDSEVGSSVDMRRYPVRFASIRDSTRSESTDHGRFISTSEQHIRPGPSGTREMPVDVADDQMPYAPVTSLALENEQGHDLMSAPVRRSTNVDSSFDGSSLPSARTPRMLLSEKAAKRRKWWQFWRKKKRTAGRES